VDGFRDLPERYQSMPAGDLISEQGARRTSLAATAVFVVLALGLGYAVWSTERVEAPRRRAALDAARAAARRR
jgi:uncharacterized protein HemX